MTVALVFPPICDPTAPYVSVPLLTAWLRSRDVEVLPVDANLEACEELLSPGALEEARGRVEARYRELNRREALPHDEQGLWLAAVEALESRAAAPETVAEALRVLRGSSPGFYEPEPYFRSAAAVDGALALQSAAYAPLSFGLSSYRSPFSLLNADERRADAGRERNPFHAYFESVLIPRLLGSGARIVGISVVFPGQIQPAYSLAYQLRGTRDAGGVHLTVGGPAMTQILSRLTGAARDRALEPFDSAVIYEGEEALLGIVRSLEQGRRVSGVLRGGTGLDLTALPAPDFRGLPLDRYLSPEPVLPYDLTRGCPWGRCAFCHYGLAERGTAPYRERDVATAVRQLGELSARHGARIFHFSEDSVRPETLLAVAGELASRSSPVRWSTDARPDGAMGRTETMRALRRGGALALSFGVESASPRVLRLMRKGIETETARRAITAAAGEGIASEAMVFTDFPTETGAEAMATLGFLRDLHPAISLFMCGVFGLSSGSEVAHDPGRFGIRELFSVAGDELELGLQYEPERPWKSERERRSLDAELERLSRLWRFSSYPWAGSLSTAHSLLWYDRHGPEVFRRIASAAPLRPGRAHPVEPPRFDRTRLRASYDRNEGRIWDTMVWEERAVSRSRHRALAAAIPRARPRGDR